MRSYYKKDEKELTIKNLEIKDNITKIELKETVLRKDIIYYDNIFGAIKRFSDDRQTLTREEAYDIIHHYIDNSSDPEQLVGTIGLTFIDTATRWPIKIPKEELNKLKAEKKERKKLQKIRKRK